MTHEVPVLILILAIPVYFLTKWILMKLKLGSEKNRKYLAIIPTIILSAFLYVGIIMIWIFSVSYYPKTDFNKQVLIDNKEDRYKMSNDIIKNEKLIGKTKEQVIEILGNDFYFYEESHISYYLGVVPGLFNIDPDVLDIFFEKGIVIKVGQHET